MPLRRARVSLAERTGVFSGLDDVPGPANRACGVGGEDLADDEPVEEHPERREMLLDGCWRARAGELLDVGRDHHGLDLDEGKDSVLAPPGEASGGREVGETCVRVPDVDGEVLPEATLGAH